MMWSAKKSLSIKMLYGIACVTLLCAFLIISVQLIFDYNQEMSNAASRLATIADSYAPGLTDSLWNIDEDQSHAIMSGIMKLPGVAYAKVLNSQGEAIDIGSKPINFFIFSKDLNYKDKKIGVLELYLDKDEIRKNIFYRGIFLVISQLLAIILVSSMIIWLLSNLIIKPLVGIKNHLGKIDFSQKPEPIQITRFFFKKSDDELDVLLSSLGKMEQDLYSYTNNLESIVKERTEQLWEKNRNINKILSNIKQGILTIDENLKIRKEYSKYLEEIFQLTKLEGTDVRNLLIDNAKINDNDKSQIVTTLLSAFENDNISFELNSHLLPREIERHINGKIQILEIEWDTILSEQGSVDSLMIVVRDISDLKKLQEVSAKQERELNIIGEIIKMGTSVFLDFYNSSKQYLVRSKEVLFGEKVHRDEVGLLFRNMHTLKGNARTFNLTYFIETLHQSEQQFANKMKEAEDIKIESGEIEEFKTNLDYVDFLLEEYRKILEEKLGKQQQSQKEEEYLQFMQLIEKAGRSPDKDKFYQIVYEKFKELNFKSLESYLQEVVVSFKQTCDSLAKPVPKIVYKEECIAFSCSYKHLISGVFVHLLRNSIDHGIEGVEERRTKGKTEYGNIEITTRHGQDDNVEIIFKDDGAGINITKLKNIALERKYFTKTNISNEELAGTIFLAGVTTKEQVSDISGRGVGMDAVRKFLQEIGGDIQIVLLKKLSDSDFIPFQFIISLPKEAFICLLDHHQVSSRSA